VFGAAGRMGAEVCRAVAAQDDLDLVAAVDPGAVGARLATVAGPAVPDLAVAGEAGALAEAGAEVAVDFTRPDAVMANLRWCAASGVHAVVGTSGLGEADLAELASLFGPGTTAHCVVAPNFAIGAVLMMRFAAMAAPYFDTAEIIELHHDTKIDAPSGTAIATARAMAAARNGRAWAPDPTTEEVLDGARGGSTDAGVHIHSVRMRGMVANQEVILGTTGQTLCLRHDTIDRTSFMPGVLLAVRGVGVRPGLTVGLDALLGLGG